MLRILSVVFQLQSFLLLVLASPKNPSSDILLTLHKNATSFPIRDRQPLGISFEFEEFPAFMTKVNQTSQCLLNLESALGAPPPTRIAGTAQEMAYFAPAQKEALVTKVISSDIDGYFIAIGPEFFKLAAKLPGPTTLGLSRVRNSLDNTTAIAKQAIAQMKNLYALELGDNPQMYIGYEPLTHGVKWTPEIDAQSQIYWQRQISKAVGKTGLIQAGGFHPDRDWSIEKLAPQELDNSQYVQSFGVLAYPDAWCDTNSNVADLMSPSTTASFVKTFEKEVAASDKLGKPLHVSGSNLAACADNEAGSTFGAGLWLIDHVFQSLILGVHRLYFRQQWYPLPQSNFWCAKHVAAPYYGAYFTALALQNASHIEVVESANPAVSAYVLRRCLRIIRIVVYNSEGYSAKPTKETTNFQLPGLPPRIKTARLLRLTAQDELDTKTDKDGPNIGNSYFHDATCKLNAPPRYEPVRLEDGTLYFSVRASEAVLIEFNDGEIEQC